MSSRPIPPDGGWGWVVVVATFFAHTITHGILYSFGVMFAAIQDRYGTDKATTSWVASLATGSLFLSGPLASAITTRYGCRAASVTGGILSFLGLALVAIVSDVYVLFVGFGLMAGVGYGLVFLSSIVSVNQYFDKKRAMACTVSLSGCAVGAFIFNPLLKLCLDTYGLNGTFLLEAAIVLNCVVSGVTLAPIATRHVSLLLTQAQECTCITSEIGTHANQNKEMQIPGDSVSLKSKENATTITCRGTIRGTSKLADINSKNAKCCSSVDIRNDQLSNDIGSSFRSVPDSILKSEADSMLKQSLLRASLWNSGHLMFPALSMASISKSSIRATECSCQRHEQEDEIVDLPTSRGCYAARKYLGLFNNIKFIIFLLAQVSLHLGVYLPFIYLPDLAISKGISEYTAAWIVSMIGVSSIAGRIFFGYLGDLKCVDRKQLLNAALLISGASTAFVPCYNGVISLMAYAVVYGVFVGVAICFSTVVLVDLVGISQLPRAFGIVNMFNGIACLIGPPLAGLAFDRVGNYDVTFPVAGAVMAMGSLLLYINSCHSNRRLDIVVNVLSGMAFSINYSMKTTRQTVVQALDKI